MSKPISRDPSENLPAARADHSPRADRRPADVEMARVLRTAPLRMASDPSSGTIAHWKHGALHDVVEPMTDHVIMTYAGSMQRLERRPEIGCDWNGAYRGCDDHSGRLELPMGHSRARQCRSALSSAHERSSALPAKPTGGTRRSPGANGASRPHYIPAARQCGRCRLKATRRWMPCSGSN